MHVIGGNSHELELDLATDGAGYETNLVRYALSDGGRTLTAREQVRGLDMDHDNVWVFARRQP